MNPYLFQDAFADNLSQRLTQYRKIVGQLATGGGKTNVFSGISYRYITRSPQSVLILVHRKELLQQTRRTLFKKHSIIAQVIVAGMKHIPPARVYVGMVESVHKRIGLLQDIGLVIIDEAHLANFNKLHAHFPMQYIIGFTATPLSSNKKNPMNKWYQEIVCGPGIDELIQLGVLSQNITWAPKDVVDRGALSIDKSTGDYDIELMAMQFSKPKYINNTVQAYQSHANNTKAIVFNVNISHSILVTQAFRAAGYDAMHLDGTMGSVERTHILNWYHTTPGAILNNVGVATTGFDEPTIETVIPNKSTASMPLWLQMCGRGSRVTKSKSSFCIIDMGGNAVTHGDWNTARDWNYIFHNPPKPNEPKDSVPASKSCPQCDAILPAPARSCKYCGYEFPVKAPPPETPIESFIVVTRGIDVAEVIAKNATKKQLYQFYEIGNLLARSAKEIFPEITDQVFDGIFTQYKAKLLEWQTATRNRYNMSHPEWIAKARVHLQSEIDKLYYDKRNNARRLPPGNEAHTG